MTKKTSHLVILDRDGVINHDSDHYIRSVQEFRPLPRSIEAIAALSQAGFTVAIATNQSAIARGYLPLSELQAIHAQLLAEVRRHGGTIASIQFCPHHPDQSCLCRKPRTGMIDNIEKTLQTSAVGAFFVGDSLCDIGAARAAGCRPVVVRTGKGKKTIKQSNKLQDTLIFNDLYDFSAFAIKDFSDVL